MSAITGASEWEILIGVSNSCINNGMWSEETGPSGSGTKSADIEVFVPDLAPNANGTIVPGVAALDKEDSEITDPFTKEKSTSSIPRVKTIRCQYMGGQNFLIPCVHVNEQVWVLHHAGNSEGWFWLPMGRDKGIRLREHIRWYAMNRSKSIEDGDINVITDDNTYFIDINTNKSNDPNKPQKMIQIHTSKNDGEPVGYDIRMFPEREWLEIVDTYGNYLHLDSKNTIWKIFNRDHSTIELNKRNISIFCDNNLVIGAGNSMKIAVGNSQKATAVNQVGTGGAYNLSSDTKSNSLTIDVGDTLLEKITKTITIKTVSYNETASTNLITAVTTHNGTCTVNGATTVNASAIVSADAVIGGKSFLGHMHIGNLGAPTTPPL